MKHMMMVIILLVNTQMIVSMEEEPMVVFEGGGSSPDDSYFTNLTNYAIEGINSLSGAINNNLTSAGNTLRMAASQAERFKKVGWPPVEDTQKEFAETLAIYAAVEKMKEEKNFTNEKAALLLRFDKRVVIINEFIGSFVLNPQNSEGLLRARHTLQYHVPVLAEYYKNMVLAYVEVKRDVLITTSASLDKELQKFGVRSDEKSSNNNKKSSKK
jgi:hypothetical protein